ncbi:PREDICTED: synaptic vesicle glycoprotein 2A-like, partial [Rhagoletis zephyria]|uniref:synaptic vesicle glycoprotein 2A-like n=1 Tax=Rhagoletis zephyria TaxID=28612 RepID=UPI0008112956
MDNSAYIAELENEFGEQKNATSQVYTHSFDEALGLTRVGRFHYMLMLISGLCFLAVMTETLCMGMIIPFVKCDLEASEGEQGLLASAGFFGIMLSSHMVGFLADTAGRVRTLQYSLTLAATTTIIAAFSVNLWMLIVFRFLNGFFISGCQACVYSLVGEFHSNKTRIRYVALLTIFLPLAFVILPAVGLVILPLQFDSVIFGMRFTSWRLFFLINTTLSFSGLAGLCTLPETPKYMLVHGNHDGALNTLRSIYSKNTGDNPENFPVKSILLETGGADLANIHGVSDAFKMIWSQTMPLFYRQRCLQTLNICFSLFVTFGVSEGLFMWFPTILNELIAKNGQGLKVCEIIGGMEPIAHANDCSGSIDNFMFQVLMMVGVIFILVFVI